MQDGDAIETQPGGPETQLEVKAHVSEVRKPHRVRMVAVLGHMRSSRQRLAAVRVNAHWSEVQWYRTRATSERVLWAMRGAPVQILLGRVDDRRHRAQDLVKHLGLSTCWQARWPAQGNEFQVRRSGLEA